MPSAITVASFADLPGSPAGRGGDYDQGQLYGVTDNGGSDPDFFVWSVGAGGTLTQLAAVDLATPNRGVAVVGTRAFVVSNNGSLGLSVVDVTIPTAPTRIGSMDTLGSAAGVSTYDGLAYLASANNTRELQIASGETHAAHPPLGVIRDPSFVAVSITGTGLGDGAGASLIFQQGVQTLTVAADTTCTPPVVHSCVEFWSSDWITAKVPPTWTRASVQVVTGAGTADRSEVLRVQYRTLDFVSSIIGAATGAPVAIATVPSDPLHRLWLNDEHHYYFKVFQPGVGGTVLPLSHPTPPPFHAAYLGSPNQSIYSAGGEDTMIDPYGRVWFTEGGWGPPPGYWNYSRIVMYRWDAGNPGVIAETRVYNLPGNNPEVLALAYEQEYIPGHDRIWYSALARKPSAFFPAIIPARIGWFDPEEPGLAHDGTRVFTAGTCVSNSCTGAPFQACCAGNTTRRCAEFFDCNLAADVCYSNESNPGCKFHEYKLPASTYSVAHIQRGPDGAIWWADYWGTSNLGRLDPATGQVTLYPLGDDPSRGTPWLLGSAPWELVVSQGDIVVNEYSDSVINRFDVARAGDAACLTLEGQQNPCMTSRFVPGATSAYSQHTVFADTHDNVWFGIAGPVNPPSKAAIGYVKRDWRDIVMLPPVVLYPLPPGQTPAGKSDAGSGVTVDATNDQVWFGEYCRKRLGRLIPTGVDLALTRAAVQSSTVCFFGVCGPASAAVDGDIDGNYFAGSVAHTFDTNRPWWQVDLGAVRSIEDVEIWNRTDCCGDRLQNFAVFVSDTPFTSNDPFVVMATPGVLTIQQVAPVGRRFLAAVNRTGRHVRVQLLGTGQPLQLAEVVVIGAQ